MSSAELWRELVRAIRVVRPRYSIVENVAALLERGMGTILGDLADIGYDAEWDCISACSLGAPHVRRRVFIVAYANGQHGWEGFWNPHARQDWPLQEIDGFESARASWQARLENPSALYRGADGVPYGMDRNHAIGNSAAPACLEAIGRAIIEVETRSTP